jgi:hypothetical protein
MAATHADRRTVQIRAILALRAGRFSREEIALALNVSRGTLRRREAELREAEQTAILMAALRDHDRAAC